MKHEPNGPILAAVFVDYDNIYRSLLRKSEEAAKRFSKDAGFWIKEIASGSLITPTNGVPNERSRRLVMNRCYGNPVPRRNTHDNSTDMNSFPFVRHHFLRGGFEVIDCPPLTAQLKNSADIRMVMDMRDLINHEAYYEEFIILSSDADFTPMLHRLRAHARQTIVFANDYTAAPYTAICDGEIRENNLLKLLLEGQLTNNGEQTAKLPAGSSAANDKIRAQIITAVVNAVRSVDVPVPLEALAERTTRVLGHDQTVATQWAGAGSFLELLRQGLPEDIKLSDQPPYMAFEAKRIVAKDDAPRIDQLLERPARSPEPSRMPEEQVKASRQVAPPSLGPDFGAPTARPKAPETGLDIGVAEETTTETLDAKSETLQKFISRIHEASQVPVLSPSDYRKLFVVIADELNENNLQGAQTLTNIMRRAAEKNVEIRRDDVRFIVEVIGEADPWFEQGASANLFAGRFHNFVVARCRSQGLNLSIEDLDLIEAWFAGNGEPALAQADAERRVPEFSEPRMSPRGGGSPIAEGLSTDDFPRILQNRGRD